MAEQQQQEQMAMPHDDVSQIESSVLHDAIIGVDHPTEPNTGDTTQDVPAPPVPPVDHVWTDPQATHVDTVPQSDNDLAENDVTKEEPQ